MKLLGKAFVAFSVIHTSAVLAILVPQWFQIVRGR